MNKLSTVTLALVAALGSTSAMATPDTPTKPHHAEYPSLSTPHSLTKIMPTACKHPVAVGYVEDFQKIHYRDIKPNRHGASGASENGWVTWGTADDIYKLRACPKGGAIDSDDGVCWLELSDKPIVMGIAAVAPGKKLHPHYHKEPECYYGLDGTSHTWANGKMNHFEKGDFLFLESKAMHYTNVTGKSDMVWPYWFPMDGEFATFGYTWPESEWVKDKEGIKMMFELLPYNYSKEVRSGNAVYGF